MIRKARGLLAGLALLAGTAGTASATLWDGNGSYCGGSGFDTCFSVLLSWTFVDATTISVELQLKNDDTFNCNPADCSAGPLKWFGVGMDNLPDDIVSDFLTGPAGYSDPPPNDLTGDPFVDDVAMASNSGGSFPGTSYRTWNFTFTGDPRTAAEWDALMNAAGVGYHAGGALAADGSPCPSTKVVVRDNLVAGSDYGTNTGPASLCDLPDTPLEIVPEPMTMSLMALGLVGIAGAGVIRRRRKV